MRKLFSVDDHIMEPANIFTDRVAGKFKERVPHVVKNAESGREEWLWEGGEAVATGLYAVAGKPAEEWNFDPIGYADMIPGCYDPRARARDFLSQGICASAAFPTLPGFSGDLFLKFKDRELSHLCVEAYNDFIIDEWCAAGPKGLYVPMVLTKLWDPEATAKEIHRCVDKGAKAISFTENPVGLGLPSFWTDHWDPVWRACEETGIPVCMHIGTGSQIPVPSPEAPSTLFISLSYIAAMAASLNIAMSPVCRKFEKLKLVFSEGGIGWIPAALERADFQWVKHAPWTKLTGTLPSEIFRRNMYVCMIHEPVALQSVRHLIGVDRIFWENDYPHADTPWPHVQEAVAEQVEGIPRPEADMVLYENAERVFDWKIADLDSPEVKAIIDG
jgi:predicted TIM-barrel fold metal-dependent hydrolase